jgi:hypothetical protein
MIIQLVAESDEAKAKEQLDKEGGYVTSRVVKLLNVTNIEEFGVESLPSEEG